MTNQPWTLDPPNQHSPREKIDQYLHEWAKLSSSDFFFSFQRDEDDDSSLVCIVPIAYFKQFGHMLKTSMPISHLLPLYMTESIPSVFCEDKGPSDKLFWYLSDKGFKQDKSFQNFITNTDRLAIYG